MPTIYPNPGSSGVVTTAGAQTIIGPKTLSAASPTSTPLTIKGLTGQSAPLLSLSTDMASFSGNILELRDEANKIQTSIDVYGGVSAPYYTSVAPASGFGNLISFKDSDLNHLFSVSSRGDLMMGPAQTSAARLYVQGRSDRTYSAWVQSGGATNIPLYVQGAAGQTGDLQRWVDSAGTVLSYIAPNGSFVAGGGVQLYPNTVAATNTTQVYIPTTATTNRGLVIKGMASQTANLTEWQNSANTTLAFVSADGSYLTSGAVKVGSTTADYVSMIQSTIPFPGIRGLVVRGAASQTANLAEFQNSSGTILALVNSVGQIVSGGPAGQGSARLVAGTNARSGYVQFDQANGPRAGYIGWSSSTGTTDGAGNIEYQAGNHTFYTTGAGTVYIHGSGGLQGSAPHMWIGQSLNVDGTANHSSWIRMAGPGLRHGDFTFHPGEGGVYRFRYSETANFQYHAPIYAGSYSNVSLLETKDHIETIDVSAASMTEPARISATPTPEGIVNEPILDRFRRLRPVAFIQKGLHENPNILDQVQHSFVAEEAAEVLPEVVSIDSDGKPDGINLGAVGTLNTAMIQHLLDRVEKLEQELKDTRGGK